MNWTTFGHIADILGIISFLLSLGIESWQFAAGTGIAQGTDVLCNTLGACMGGMFLKKIFFKKKNARQ